MKLRCIVVDDEPLALELVAKYVGKTAFLELVAKCPSPLEAMEILNSQEVELIFLDVQMPDLTGIEFSKTLEKGPKIIFTTAYEKYAIEGFKVDAIDYLLKPFSFADFLKAASKAKEYFELLQRAETNPKSTEDYIFVKSEYKLRKIFLDEIIYIEGLKDYVKICTSDAPILSLSSLKALEKKLPAEKFMRVHRSFIVNLANINTIERNRIIFGDVYIPISDQYKEKFQQFLEKNFL